MRIISGKARGTKLYTLDGENTRPTLDRVKEPLFNILNFKLNDSVVLDLFAGSGQLGIEAISNGAKLCYFIDHNNEVIKVLNKNIVNLNIKDKSRVVLTDWKKFLNECSAKNLKFDLIFIDPPYDYDVYEKIIDKVSNLNLLNNDGLLVLEHHNLKLKESYDNLILYKTKKYGNKSVNIYKSN